MSTTTIRISNELKARVARAAQRAGKSAHGFIVEAIAEEAELEERRADFHGSAEQRLARIVETGQTIPWPALQTYLRARATGKPARRPAARAPRRKA
jgi:predicted transcriptional regulator